MDLPHRVNVQSLEYKVSNIDLQRLVEKQFDLIKKPWNKRWAFNGGGGNLPIEVLFTSRVEAQTFAETLNALFGIVVHRPFEVASPAPADAVWTQERATKFVDDIQKHLSKAGFARPQLIGGVQKFGFSKNDLDLLLKPGRKMSLEDAIEAVESQLLPLLSDERTVNPLECGDHHNVWFLNVELRPGNDGIKRVVEFYLDEEDFPMEEDAQVERSAPRA